MKLSKNFFLFYFDKFLFNSLQGITILLPLISLMRARFQNIKINAFANSDCNDPPLPPADGELIGVDPSQDSAGTYPVGAIATYRCDSNSVFQGSVNVVCVNNGEWDAVILTCTQGMKIFLISCIKLFDQSYNLAKFRQSAYAELY